MRTAQPGINLTVLVVALGYFVDILDLTLFGMVRIQSLQDLGYSGSDLVEKGMDLLNAQMLGMLIGGLLWGKIADIHGRMSTMFYSIILYSLANLANAGITTYDQYLILRLLSGIGLAGELGVGITLVAELLPRESRGWGTTMVATIGVLGAVLGGLLVEHFSGRTCYAIGGCLGLGLLALRFSVRESELFQSTKVTAHVKGRLLMIFCSREKFLRLLTIVLIGVPIWFVAGIVMILSPEIAKELGVLDPILSSRSISISYLGLAAGDFLSGFLSQILKSRKKALYVFQISTWLLVLILFFTAGGRGESYFYITCFLIGVGAGFWALFITVAAEAFGTNLRASAATSIPNFVRASVIPMNLAVAALRTYSLPLWQASLVVGSLVFMISLYCTYSLKETYGISLDYQEV